MTSNKFLKIVFLFQLLCGSYSAQVKPKLAPTPPTKSCWNGVAGLQTNGFCACKKCDDKCSTGFFCLTGGDVTVGCPGVCPEKGQVCCLAGLIQKCSDAPSCEKKVGDLPLVKSFCTCSDNPTTCKASRCGLEKSCLPAGNLGRGTCPGGQTCCVAASIVNCPLLTLPSILAGECGLSGIL